MMSISQQKKKPGTMLRASRTSRSIRSQLIDQSKSTGRKKKQSRLKSTRKSKIGAIKDMTGTTIDNMGQITVHLSVEDTSTNAVEEETILAFRANILRMSQNHLMLMRDNSNQILKIISHMMLIGISTMINNSSTKKTLESLLMRLANSLTAEESTVASEVTTQNTTLVSNMTSENYGEIKINTNITLKSLDTRIKPTVNTHTTLVNIEMTITTTAMNNMQITETSKLITKKTKRKQMMKEMLISAEKDKRSSKNTKRADLNTKQKTISTKKKKPSRAISQTRSRGPKSKTN